MIEQIPIPQGEHIKGYLKTSDGLVILRSDLVETFEIAKMLLALCEKRLEES